MLSILSILLFSIYLLLLLFFLFFFARAGLKICSAVFASSVSHARYLKSAEYHGQLHYELIIMKLYCTS